MDVIAGWYHKIGGGVGDSSGSTANEHDEGSSEKVNFIDFGF